MNSTICKHRNRIGALFLSLGVHLLVLFLFITQEPKKRPIVMCTEISWRKKQTQPSKTADQITNKQAQKINKHSRNPKNNNAAFQKLRASDDRALTGEDAKEVLVQESINNNIIIYRPRPLLSNNNSLKIPYPPRAKRQKIEGTVKMLLTVSENGLVIKAEILSAPAFDLKKAALKIAEKMLFLPATDENGLARIAEVEHEVIFRLYESS